MKYTITITKPLFAVYTKTVTAKNILDAQDKVYTLAESGLLKPRQVIDKTRDALDCFVEVRKS